LHSLYNIGIFLYGFALRLAAPFVSKAKLWTEGRKDVISSVKKWRENQQGRVIWVHCASLGEFEQGRPIIEFIKSNYPDIRILLTFFSPSGYEIRKNYAQADYICYLPLDTSSLSRQFVHAARPSASIFVKYEYWANYFFQLKKEHIPLFIVSGIFREDQRFFGSQKAFWSSVFSSVDHFFLQNKNSQLLLQRVSDRPSTVCGDTRYDRVEEIAKDFCSIEQIAEFAGNANVLIGGSTYASEEKIIRELLDEHSNWKAIIAPHEIEESRLKEIEQLYGSIIVRFSQWNKEASNSARVMLIDNMGMLSRIYHYGHIALIGGGFGKGIHNTLEAAVYGMPLFFGPRYHKFDEAVQLIASGAAESAEAMSGLQNRMTFAMNDLEKRKKMGASARIQVEDNLGSVAIIIKHLENQGILAR
jgi:3-deoxy-D-manno-octulosonic-acid transferase